MPETFPEIRPTTRISVRAIFAGTLMTMASLMLLFSFLFATGIWSFDMTGPFFLNLSFWILSFALWVIAVFIGGFVAALAVSSPVLKDSVLNSLVTWAFSCIFITLVPVVGTYEVFDFSGGSFPSNEVYWIVFFGNVFSVAAAYFAGHLATRMVRRVKPKPRAEVRSRVPAGAAHAT